MALKTSKIVFDETMTFAVCFFSLLFNVSSSDCLIQTNLLKICSSTTTTTTTTTMTDTTLSHQCGGFCHGRLTGKSWKLVLVGGSALRAIQH